MGQGMSKKSSEDASIINDVINSAWGSRIIGGIFVAIALWAIGTKIAQGLG